MKKLPTIMFSVALFLLILWGIWFLIKEPSYNDNISVDLLSGCVLFLSFLVAIYTYLGSRKRDEHLMAEKRRENFIMDKEFKKIRMLIEHNDIKLQTVIAITNIMKCHKPGLLPQHAMELHEEFDAYLAYMESIAILAKQDGIVDASLQGYWSYYFKRLRGVHLYDFDNSSHPTILINDINHCIDDLYKDDINAADAIKAEFKKYISSYESKGKEGKRIADANDPIEEAHEKDKLKVARINPVARPIWYYIINKRDYEFESIIELFVSRLYKTKYVSLYEDGF